MPGSTRSFLFPDVNVWLALTYERHVHHTIAHDWFDDVESASRLSFWLQDDRVDFLDEPAGLERRFRSATQLRHPAPKDWADSYLIAFAGVAQLTLVTFDRALRTKARPLVLLSE